MSTYSGMSRSIQLAQNDKEDNGSGGSSSSGIRATNGNENAGPNILNGAGVSVRVDKSIGDRKLKLERNPTAQFASPYTPTTNLPQVSSMQGIQMLSVEDDQPLKNRVDGEKESL